MYLKKLEIFGFKSFGEKVEIEFKDGIVAIVGPNGSGKSNVTDAIKWVLGEQKIKSLRGDKMEDVIFAGSQVRKPLGYAEVSLTIDNSTKLLPIEYEEVTITRRLFRSGDSEYYLNKTACRLKDIQQIFMDTGLGKEGYSIIGQGKIQSIINSNSNDRRYMFEEAAGIIKYKTRKGEAERKLDKTQDNLYRVTDIIVELEKQLKPLERQSSKAKKYLLLRDELKEIELNVFAHQIDKYKLQLNKLLNDKKLFGENIKDKENEIQSTDLKYQNIKQKITELDNKINNTNSLIFNLSEEANQSKTEIEILTNKIENINGNIFNIETEIEELSQSDNFFNDTKAKYYIEIKELEDIIKVFTNELNKITEKKDNILNIINLKKNQNKEIAIKKEKLSKELFDTNNKNNKLESNISYHNLTIQHFNSEATVIKKENDEIVYTKGQISQELNNITIILEDKEKDIKKIENNIKEKRIEYQSIIDKKNLLENNINVSKSKLNILSSMNLEYKGYFHSVKRLLEKKDNDTYLKNNLFGVVGEIFDVPSKFAKAIEVALGSSIQNLVTTNEETAHYCIKMLNRNKWGRATFLPLNIIKSNQSLELKNLNKHKGYIDTANKLISCNTKFNTIKDSLLGRVLVVDSMENGITLAKKLNYKYKIVTINGEIFYPGGAIVGGEKNTKNISVLTNKAEILDLKDKIKTFKNELSKVAIEIIKVEEEITNHQKSYEKLIDKFNSLKERKISFEQQITQINSSLNKNEKRIHYLNESILNKEQEIQESTLEMNNISSQIEDISNKLKGITVNIENQENVEEEEKKLLDYNNNISQTKVEIIKLEEKINYLNSKIHDINNNLQENIARKETKQKNILNMQKQIKDFSISIKILKSKETNFITDTQSNKLALALSIKEKEELNEDFELLSLKIKEFNKELMVMNEGLNKLEININKIQIEIDHLEQNIFEEYQVNYIMALEFKRDIENLTLEINKTKELKKKIKVLGNINIGAIEEYKRINERYNFLINQRDDLLNAKEELNQIIREMAISMETQFNEQFKLIQNEFEIVFKKLFNGGSAKLVIDNPYDLMNSGIEIVAQPPNKKLKNISLLSGGEKALTAIAMLFAIIKIKPAPFCVLDEIDAALDDNNVERFAEFLASITKTNQFITITHRKGTMEIADCLYGVTMSNDGVSKLISVNISDFTN